MEYTNKELRDLENEIEKYKITRTLSDGDEVTFYDEERILVDFGFHNKYGSIFSEKINEYEEFQEKLWAMYLLQGKTKYAKKIEEMELEKIEEKTKENLF